MELHSGIVGQTIKISHNCYGYTHYIDYPDVSGYHYFASITSKETKEGGQGTKTVRTVGCQLHIGITAQALQLTLCLMHMGYNTAYVEIGERDYIGELGALYQGIIIDKNDIIYYQSVPLYTGSRIILTNRGRYDYVIKDYGYIGNPGFGKISFLEQHIEIVAGGAKANEADYVEQVIEGKYYENVNYIFSFTGLSEQRDVKETMKSKKEQTHFAVYTPDPFTYVENGIYEYILGD